MTEGPTNPGPTNAGPVNSGTADAGPADPGPAEAGPARPGPAEGRPANAGSADAARRGAGRGLFSVGGGAPAEIRLASSLLVTAALLFVLVDVLRLATEPAGDSAFVLPLLQLVIAIGVAGGLLRGMRSARLFGVLFVLTVAFVHMLIALQSTLPVWVRIIAGIIAASQVYVAVLLNTRPALQYSGGVRRR